MSPHILRLLKQWAACLDALAAWLPFQLRKHIVIYQFFLLHGEAP
jgi:hypothetical protein